MSHRNARSKCRAVGLTASDLQSIDGRHARTGFSCTRRTLRTCRRLFSRGLQLFKLRPAEAVRRSSLITFFAVRTALSVLLVQSLCKADSSSIPLHDI